MKRKVAKPKPVSLRDQVRLLCGDVQSVDFALATLAEEIKENNRLIEGLGYTPLAAVREIDKILGKLEDLGLEKAEKIDAIFPNLPAQFNAMAEAVNKISAYAKALDESGSGWSLRQNVRARIEEETDEELLAKLKHRLARMEQKL